MVMTPLGERLMAVDQIADYLRGGGAALLPTDTLPALACTPSSAAQIWTLKQRPQDKPLILMAAEAVELLDLTTHIAKLDALPLAERYWPGPLTLVLPAAGALVNHLNPGQDSLGMRIPACAATRSLLARSGPLATTSANRSGAPPSCSAEQAAAAFSDLPLLGPLPWPKPSGLASTVLKWMSPGCWQILRQGAVMVPDGSA